MLHTIIILYKSLSYINHKIQFTYKHLNQYISYAFKERFRMNFLSQITFSNDKGTFSNQKEEYPDYEQNPSHKIDNNNDENIIFQIYFFIYHYVILMNDD